MLRLSNIYKHIDNNPIINGIDLSINKGEIFAFFSCVGGGKSTLLDVISSKTLPNVGDVLINGENTKNSSFDKSKFSYFFGGSIDFDGSALEYLKFVGKLNGVSKHKLISKIQLLCDEFDFNNVLNKNVGILSDGHTQMLLLISKMVLNYSVLILDNPTDFLDSTGKNNLLRVLLNLKEAGKTIIIATNHAFDVINVADRFAVLKNGRIKIISSIEMLKNKSIEESCTLNKAMLEVLP